MNDEKHYVICSVCGKCIETDERGDVLDSSRRCDECRP
jgi:RNA polymerase-binding transcription factor DksA